MLAWHFINTYILFYLKKFCILYFVTVCRDIWNFLKNSAKRLVISWAFRQMVQIFCEWDSSSTLYCPKAFVALCLRDSQTDCLPKNEFLCIFVNIFVNIFLTIFGVNSCTHAFWTKFLVCHLFKIGFQIRFTSHYYLYIETQHIILKIFKQWDFGREFYFLLGCDAFWASLFLQFKFSSTIFNCASSIEFFDQNYSDKTQCHLTDRRLLSQQILDHVLVTNTSVTK